MCIVSFIVHVYLYVYIWNEKKVSDEATVSDASAVLDGIILHQTGR